MNAPDSLVAACALTGDEAGGRRTRWRAVLADGRAHSDAVDGGVRVHVDGRPGVRERLESLVAAERECCGFLDWRIGVGPERVTLDVLVPSGDPALVAAVRGEFRAPPTRA